LKKILFIILICIVIFIILIIIANWKNILRSFKPVVSLNYQEDIANIEYIEISDKGRFRVPADDNRFVFKIYDKEEIKKIIDYLNSLELIADKRSIKYNNDLNSIGYFTIFIQKRNLDHTLIEFMTNYLTFLPNGYDWEYTEYYIKDSGYNPKTAKSKTFDFLYDLIHNSE